MKSKFAPTETDVTGSSDLGVNIGETGALWTQQKSRRPIYR